MSVPAVLIRKSTKEILKHAPYFKSEVVPPTEEDALDPDLEWLIINIPYAEADYDSRIYIGNTDLPDLQLLETIPDHPNYPGLKEYRITYSQTRRENDDIIISIDNREKEANNLIWTEGEHKDKQIQMMEASLKKATGATLNDFEESLLTQMSIITVKLSKNRDNRNILVGQVNANQVPNIDQGWESAQ